MLFESLYQSFEDSAAPQAGRTRIAALRKELNARNLDGFIIPRADEHQGEYVPASAERLAWLTGFTGSAGTAIVLQKRAAVFIDGRYTLQVRDQVDIKILTPVDTSGQSPSQWLSRHAVKGMRIAFDPWLTTPAAREAYAQAAKIAGAQLVATDTNPVDAIWPDRPPAPATPVQLHPLRHAGMDTRAKFAAVRDKMGDADVFVISDPHDLCWILNIRGADVPHTPLIRAFAILPRKGKLALFIDAARFGKEEAKTLRRNCEWHAPNSLLRALQKMGKAKAKAVFDSATGPCALVDALANAGGQTHVTASPIRALKAIKNKAELKGARAAHLRDGAAMTRFLTWFDSVAPSGRITETDAVCALETFRRETGKLKEISFPTISGAGPNGAIVHYRVTRKTDRHIGKGLFLLDSGAQYEDGTTDITRTICVGTPTRDMRDCFTRVLKGHIAIARAVFPQGTSGAQIDALARLALWEAGLDYDHGTGHGVGSFLSVHEGPQNISKRGSVALEAGMILSNEPGYYRNGAWGIRIENLVVVEPCKIERGDRAMLGFETLTLAPIDLRLIDTKMMTRDELKWLDAYHARVWKMISPLVDAPAKKWLRQATRSLGKA